MKAAARNREFRLWERNRRKRYIEANPVVFKGTGMREREPTEFFGKLKPLIEGTSYHEVLAACYALHGKGDLRTAESLREIMAVFKQNRKALEHRGLEKSIEQEGGGRSVAATQTSLLNLRKAIVRTHTFLKTIEAKGGLDNYLAWQNPLQHALDEARKHGKYGLG